jgi:hypothetical protein
LAQWNKFFPAALLRVLNSLQLAHAGYKYCMNGDVMSNRRIVASIASSVTDTALFEIDGKNKPAAFALFGVMPFLNGAFFGSSYALLVQLHNAIVNKSIDEKVLKRSLKTFLGSSLATVLVFSLSKKNEMTLLGEPLYLD